MLRIDTIFKLSHKTGSTLVTQVEIVDISAFAYK